MHGVSGSSPKPSWLKKKLPEAGPFARMGSILRSHRLHTVCEGAACPNRGECFADGTATFLIMGSVCTRDCRFCNIPGGVPEPIDPEEPKQVAEAARVLGLSHVVVTSVTRDDLPDGGASHFVQTIRAIRKALPHATVEVLVPDFAGSQQAIHQVLAEQPEVFNHNVETVPRLYLTVRPQADFRRSLEVLRQAVQEASPRSIVKTGFMVGLGETDDEVRGLLAQLSNIGVDVVTVGQYLRPSPRHLPVVEYIAPEVFDAYRVFGEQLGLVMVSGPFVRSSFRAEESYKIALARKVRGRVRHR